MQKVQRCYPLTFKMCKTKNVTKQTAKYVSGEADRTNDDQYALMVKDCDPNKYTFAVGGFGLDMLIDSGATSYFIDEVTWETLKSKIIACH